MGRFLYIIALLLVALWSIGYFGFHLGTAIHILLIIAVVITVLKFFSHRNTV